MYKRRDWNLFNAGARADDSTDEDSDPENDGRGALDELSDDSDLSSGDEDSDTGSDDDEDDTGSDDDDDDSADDEEQSESEETPTELTGKPPKDVAPDKGIAVKCRLCPGVLCLSEQSLQQHLASKKHKKRMAQAGVTDDMNAIYQTLPDGRKLREDDEFPDIEGYSDGEAETHAERIARLRASKILEDPAAEGGADVDSDGEPIHPNEKRYRLADLDSDDDSGGGSDSDVPEGGYVHESLLKKDSKKAAPGGKKKDAGGRQRQRKRAKKGDDGGEGKEQAKEKKKGKPGRRQREAMKAAREAEAEAEAKNKPPVDTRPRKNKARLRAEAEEAAAAQKKGAYDFTTDDLEVRAPTMDTTRGAMKMMKSAGRGGGRGGGGRGGRGGGRGVGRGGGRGGGRGRGRR